MKESHMGLLLWGPVGTGKSYIAGCIANALLEREITVKISGRLLIVTTNLPLKQLKEESSLEKRRIYDRTLEMCVPEYVGGKNRRCGISGQRMNQMRQLLADHESSRKRNNFSRTGTKNI